MRITRIVDTDKEGYVEEIDTDELSDEELSTYAQSGEVWAVFELSKRKEGNKSRNAESD